MTTDSIISDLNPPAAKSPTSTLLVSTISPVLGADVNNLKLSDPSRDISDVRVGEIREAPDRIWPSASETLGSTWMGSLTSHLYSVN
ncbi:hypothetical protein [Bradyrhizobium cenepequi]|uniref:hypothetical protein n=1 Tax=Bradyrhizobium cenepequi TaxID=2821403 RepID=UPI001CE30028|nr:hypothetical protein [Bradyrhizobium cenepequi]MCA6112810.1 hypothetical protein [Bradyrhizobium cenepequi]